MLRKLFTRLSGIGPLRLLAVTLLFVFLAGVVVTTPASTRRELNPQTTEVRNGATDRAADEYDFPVKPGTAKWRKFKTHDQMLRATQIPQDVLTGMSTRGLVQTVLNYPLFGDFLAYNSLQDGFNNMAVSFNGLPELLSRRDAGMELLARYRAMNPAAIEDNWSLDRQGEYDLSFTYIETLLAQDSILASITDTERQNLLSVLVEKLGLKQEQGDVFGHFGRNEPFWLLPAR